MTCPMCRLDLSKKGIEEHEKKMNAENAKWNSVSLPLVGLAQSSRLLDEVSGLNSNDEGSNSQVLSEGADLRLLFNVPQN